jgi:hypothetical protein
MGGVLARVYARGFALDQPVLEGNGADWYRRPDNWGQGDIYRLITIGSTHKGSDIPGLLQHYARHLPLSLRSLVWQIGNWKAGGKFAPGAFTDQIPGSPALLAIGRTRVPAHAIAGVAKVADMDLIKGVVVDGAVEPTYRERMLTVWAKTPDGELPLLVRQHTGREEDARELAAMRARVRDLRSALDALRISRLAELVPAPFEERRRAEASLEREIAQWEERSFLRWVAATFRNDWTDYTVSVDSALGGLRDPRYHTILPKDHEQAVEGILHGFEPRHAAIQERVIELLRGGLEAFDSDGFPASEAPQYFPPDRARFAPHKDPVSTVPR